MQWGLTFLAGDQTPLFGTDCAIWACIFRLKIFPEACPFFYFPHIVEKKTEVVGIPMRSPLCNSNYHQTFLAFPVTNIAISWLFFLSISSSTIPASVTSVINFLTSLMNSYFALRTVDERIGYLGDITKASWARCP